MGHGGTHSLGTRAPHHRGVYPPTAGRQRLGRSNARGGRAMSASPEERMRTAGGKTWRYGPEGEAPAFFDPWEEPKPTRWPGCVLSKETEEAFAAISLRDGVDFGAQCSAYVAAASAAAPKN